MQSDNPTPTITVRLSGNDYTLIFDMEAMKIAKKETGKNPLSEEFWDELVDPEVLTAFFYGLTRANHPDLTYEKIGKIIHLGNLEHAITKISEAYVEATNTGESDNQETGSVEENQSQKKGT